MRRALALGLAGAWGAARLARARRRISFEGRHVVVSGGSRGLGLVLARGLAGEGARLTLLARTGHELDEARTELEAEYGARVCALACDVSRRDAVAEAIREAVDVLGPPHALVHNAGIIQVGPAAHMTEADYAEALGVHFWGAHHLTEALLPLLPRDGTARLGYVSSVGGVVGVPHLAPYVASKHALVGYADALRAELAAENIRVTTVVPGLMRTGSHLNAHVKGQHEKEFAWFTLGDANPLLSVGSERAAVRILDALRHGDPALTLTLPALLARALGGLAPGLTGSLAKLAAGVLPEPAGPEGDRRKTGWQSRSALTPSPLTALADREAEANNELRGHEPPGQA